MAGDGKVYLVGESGLVSVLKVGGGLEPLAVNDLDEGCYATPAIADGRGFGPATFRSGFNRPDFLVSCVVGRYRR